MVYCCKPKAFNFLLTFQTNYFLFFRYVKISRAKITSKKNFTWQYFGVGINWQLKTFVVVCEKVLCESI